MNAREYRPSHLRDGRSRSAAAHRLDVWSIERGQLRHQLLYQPIRRRHPERERVPTLTDVNKPAA
jgi:hypothetical protein